MGVQMLFCLMQPIFLIGAGASVEANLPMANRLTDEVISYFRKEPDSQVEVMGFETRIRRESITAVLQYVLYGLLFEESKKSQAQDKIDIERLLNAINALAGKDDLDLDAFINTWDPAIAFLNASRGANRHFASGANDVARALERLIDEKVNGSRFRPNTSSFSNALTRAILDTTGTAQPISGTGAFKATSLATVNSLKELLKINESVPLNYLDPLIDLQKQEPDSPLVIASLNYDKVIETFCAQNQIRCSTGLDVWSKEFKVQRPNKGVFLIKLHGSLEWEIERNYDGYYENFSTSQILVDRDDRSRHGNTIRPAIIFGQRDKLTADGPFLDLLMEFRRELFRYDCNHLVVVGYSFRDPHVNTYIRNWMTKSQANKISIIDPTPEKKRILSEIGQGLSIYDSDMNEMQNQRVRLIELGAGAGLKQVVNDYIHKIN